MYTKVVLYRKEESSKLKSIESQNGNSLNRNDSSTQDWTYACKWQVQCDYNWPSDKVAGDLCICDWSFEQDMEAWQSESHSHSSVVPKM